MEGLGALLVVPTLPCVGRIEVCWLEHGVLPDNLFLSFEPLTPVGLAAGERPTGTTERLSELDVALALM